MDFPQVGFLRDATTRVDSEELAQLIGFFEGPGASAEPVADDEPLAFAGVDFLTKLRETIAKSGRFSKDELDVLMRHARAYAGGIAKARNAKQEEEDEPLAAHEGYYQRNVFADVATLSVEDGLTEWLQITPRAGSSFRHPRYGNVAFTRKDAEDMVSGFKAGLYQEHIPIDAEHQTKLSGALGYYRHLRVNEDGSVAARIELTDRGREALDKEQFRYFSPEFFKTWTDPATSRVHENVLVGGAFTTRPFFKDKSLAPLIAASEYDILGRKTQMPDSRFQRDDDGKLILDENGEPQLTEEAQKASEKAAEEGLTKAKEEATAAALKAAEEEAAKKKGEEEKEEEGATAFAEAYPEQAQILSDQADVIKNMTANDRIRRFTDLTRGQGGETDGRAWVGETEQHVKMLNSLAEAFGEDSDEFKTYAAQQAERAEQAKESELFNELGRRGGSTRTPESELEKAVKSLREKDPDLSEGEATDQVIAEQPKLYSEYLSEVEAKK